VPRIGGKSNNYYSYQKRKEDKPIYKNELEQNFATEQPNQVFVGDITYILTAEDWLYLAVFIDLYSRKVVGWSMGSRMKAQFICDALTMAIWQRQPDTGLIVHSDQGVQYGQVISTETYLKKWLYWIDITTILDIVKMLRFNR